MESETVDPIDWPLPLTLYKAVSPEHHIIVILFIIIIIMIIIIIIKNVSAALGWERLRTLCQSEHPNLIQPTCGMNKGENSWRQKRKIKLS